MHHGRLTFVAFFTGTSTADVTDGDLGIFADAVITPTLFAFVFRGVAFARIKKSRLSRSVAFHTEGIVTSIAVSRRLLPDARHTHCFMASNAAAPAIHTEAAHTNSVVTFTAVHHGLTHADDCGAACIH